MRWVPASGWSRGSSDDDGVAIEEFAAEGASIGRLKRAGEGDVDLAARQERLHLLGGAHLVEREFDVGVELAVVANDAGEEASGTPEKEADGEGADLAEERALRDVEGAVGGD